MKAIGLVIGLLLMTPLRAFCAGAPADFQQEVPEGPLKIEYVLIDTSPTQKQAQVRVIVQNTSGEARKARLRGTILSPEEKGADKASKAAPMHNLGEQMIDIEFTTAPEQTFRMTIDADEAKTWTPATPTLYTFYTAVLDEEGKLLASRKETFGWRTIRLADKRIYVNDQPIYLRGTMRLPVAYSPTHYFPAHMRRMIQAHKAMNFNFIRNHTTVPPPWYYQLADEEGIYNSIEMGFDIPRMRDIVYRYYNHPSILFWGGGNELSGMEANPDIKKWYDAMKALDPTRPVYDSTGWGEYDRKSTDISWDHFGVMLPYAVRDGLNLTYLDQSGMVFPIKGHNLYDAYDQYMESRRISRHVPREQVQQEINDGKIIIDKPQMMHEIHGASQTYTENMFEIEHLLRGFYEATGRDYSPWPDYVRANQQFSAASYKICLEYARGADRQNGFDWIQSDDCVVDINYQFRVTGNKCGPMDLAGVTDHFGNPKPYVADVFKVGNAPHLLLLKLAGEDGEHPRSFWNDETLHASIQSSCFDFAPPEKLTMSVKLLDGETVLEQSSAPVKAKFPGVGDLLQLDLDLAKVQEARQLTLRAELKGAKQYQIANTWNIWVFPRRKGQAETEKPVASSLPWVSQLKRWSNTTEMPNPAQGHLMIADTLSTDTLDFAERGGRVLVLQDPAKSGPPTVKTNYRQRDYTGYYSGYNMGVLISGSALSAFPQAGFNDLQFHPLLEYSNILVMDYLPRAFTPIMECVPVLEANRPARSGFLYEAGVGKGAVLISGMNLSRAAQNEPASMAMLCDLVAYAARKDYKPFKRTTAAEILAGLAAGRDSIWPSDSNVDESDYDTSSPLYTYADFAMTDDWGTHGKIKAFDANRASYWQARDLPGELVFPRLAKGAVSGLRIEFLDPYSTPADDGWELDAAQDANAALPDAKIQWKKMDVTCEKQTDLIWVLHFAETNAAKLRLGFMRMNALNEKAVAEGAYPVGLRAGYPTPGKTYKETARPRIREITFIEK